MLNMIHELVVKYELDKDRNINRKHKVWVKIRTDICKRTNRNYKLAQLTKKWDNFKAKQKRKMAGSQPGLQPVIVKNDLDDGMECFDDPFGDE